MRFLVTFLVAALTFTCLDLLFLGPVMGSFYRELMGPLMAEPVVVDAAIVFYLFYLAFVVGFAVIGATSAKDAFLRGAGMGLFAYGTFELTNWAVIQDWPAGLIVVDMVWGTFLTGSVALTSRLAYQRMSGVPSNERLSAAAPADEGIDDG